MSKPYFATDDVVSSRLSLRLKPDRTLGIGVQYNITPIWGIKATAAVLDYGLEFADQSDYVRNRWQSKGKTGLTVNAREYSLQAVAAKPLRKKPRRHWLAEAGIDVLDARFGIAISEFMYGFGSGDPSTGLGQGGTLTARPLKYNPYRVGLRAAAGQQWSFGAHSSLALQLVGSIGLSELERWQLDYTVWDISATVDPVSYRNVIGKRLSYVGLRSTYRFQL
ncbi:hypothetical protein N008_11690 [Hymenobacter sp. APR13]|nr:hypothetical protein N008_11690 [Hymenobacter sp. APR13]